MVHPLAGDAHRLRVPVRWKRAFACRRTVRAETTRQSLEALLEPERGVFSHWLARVRHRPDPAANEHWPGALPTALESEPGIRRPTPGQKNFATKRYHPVSAQPTRQSIAAVCFRRSRKDL